MMLFLDQHIFLLISNQELVFSVLRNDHVFGLPAENPDVPQLLHICKFLLVPLAEEFNVSKVC